jgi:hypothetical protein
MNLEESQSTERQERKLQSKTTDSLANLISGIATTPLPSAPESATEYISDS